MPSLLPPPSRHRTSLATAAALVLVAATAPAAAAAPVDVFPAAGTPTASPSTQISFRGAAAAQLAEVTVTGSASGRHKGRLRAHSDGRGASFLPDRPFAQGERVLVRARVPLTGEAGGAVAFTILRRPSIGRIRKGRGTPQLDPEGRPPEARRFHTRHDLRPPDLLVIQHDERASTDPIFVGAKAGPGQDGVMILDGRGRLLWFRRVPPPLSPYDFRVQTYQGRPVLTWWQGRVLGGKGRGYGMILSDSYGLVKRLFAGNGYRMDQHELQLTPRGTAYVNVYEPVKWDLSPIGGERRGIAWDSIVQEIDVETGLVVYEWHSLGNIDVSESYFSAKGGLPYDSFHVNSVHEETNGNLLLSGRNANLLCQVDRHSGRVVWRMGGKRSDYKMRSGTRMVGQHQAVRQPDGTIAVFDNGGSRQLPPRPDRQSRGVVLRVNERSRSVTLARQFGHVRSPLFSRSQGSMQLLPGGGAFLSWGGGNPYLTEFAADGTRLFEARFAPASDDTYRAYRLPWRGRPPTRPDIAAITGRSGTNVYPSWNGATDVAAWEVLAGGKPGALAPVAKASWADFETRIALARARPKYLAVRALDADGRELGTSATIAPRVVG